MTAFRPEGFGIRTTATPHDASTVFAVKIKSRGPYAGLEREQQNQPVSITHRHKG
jgi:hypothetical protein